VGGTGDLRLLGGACQVAGLVALATAAVPFSPTAPTRLAAALGVLGLLLGAVLRRRAERLPAGTSHAVLALASALVTLCVAASTTPAGAATTSWGFLWIAVYAAACHGRRAATLHLAAVVAGAALGLVASGAPSPLQTWGFVTAALATVTVVLARLVERLRDAADRDVLTGALTRRALLASADVLAAQARRRGAPLTLGLLDLDGFKAVNDSLGHAAGDRLLASLAAAWRVALRERDLLGRLGGDEFVVVLPATTPAEAEEVLARLRAATDEGSWTVGVARYGGGDLDAWFAAADEDLYRRKARRAHPGGAPARAGR